MIDTVHGLLLGAVMLGLAFLLVDVLASSFEGHDAMDAAATARMLPE